MQASPLRDTLAPLRGDSLLVCGGQNKHLEDRLYSPESIHPIQVVSATGVTPCTWFDSFELMPGVRSISSLALTGEQLYFTQGTRIYRLDLSTGCHEDLGIEDLDDVHELLLDGEDLVIANTGRNEIVTVHHSTGEVLKRRVVSRRERKKWSVEGLERFHLNQVFRNFDGDLMGLAHHVNGARSMSYYGRRIVNHGNGGILKVDSDWDIDLRLYAPHNVRRFGGGWIVLNSGRNEMLVLDDTWLVQDSLPLRGWGRGLLILEGDAIGYVGISAIRRRYESRNPFRQKRNWVGVEIVDIERRTSDQIEIQDIEQVNCISRITPEQAWALHQL